jgi:hypothetical protein
MERPQPNVFMPIGPNAGGWKVFLLEHAITPIQQYSYGR